MGKEILICDTLPIADELGFSIVILEDYCFVEYGMSCISKSFSIYMLIEYGSSLD